MYYYKKSNGSRSNNPTEYFLPLSFQVQYENTYQMEPPAKFRADKVQCIIEEVLHRNLNGKFLGVTSLHNPLYRVCTLQTKCQRVRVEFTYNLYVMSATLCPGPTL